MTFKLSAIAALGGVFLLGACTDPVTLGDPNDPNRNRDNGVLIGGTLGAIVGNLAGIVGFRCIGAGAFNLWLLQTDDRRHGTHAHGHRFLHGFATDAQKARCVGTVRACAAASAEYSPRLWPAT